MKTEFGVSPANFFRRFYGKSSDFNQNFILAQEGFNNFLSYFFG